MGDVNLLAVSRIAADHDARFIAMPAVPHRTAGWFEPRGRTWWAPRPERLARLREPDFDVIVWDDIPLWCSQGAGRVAALPAVCLPDWLRRRGLRSQILAELISQWRDDGGEEVHAHAKTDAGAIALSR
jgi:hypothetical protein